MYCMHVTAQVKKKEIKWRMHDYSLGVQLHIVNKLEFLYRWFFVIFNIFWFSHKHTVMSYILKLPLLEYKCYPGPLRRSNSYTGRLYKHSFNKRIDVCFINGKKTQLKTLVITGSCMYTLKHKPVSVVRLFTSVLFSTFVKKEIFLQQ